MSGKSKTSQTSTYTPNPQALQAYQALFPQAQQIAQTSYNPNTNVQVAGLDPQQLQSFNQIGDIQGQYQPYINTATQYATQAGQPISADAIQHYMDPYQQNVVNSTLANLNQLFSQQQNQVVGNAIANNALGGNRVKLAQAALAGQQGQAAGTTLGNLLSSGYGQALGAAQQDATRGLQAGSQLAGLGQLQQQLGLEGAQALFGAGAAQQGQQQNVLNAATQNAQAQTMWPYQNLQWLAGIEGGLGPLMGGTTTGTGTQSQSGGLGSMIGGGLSLLSLFSDERVKEDIRPVGMTFDGQLLHKFRYKGHPETHIGLIAQEVEQKHPEAVGSVHGIKTVDYDKATPGYASGGGVNGFGNYSSYFPWMPIATSNPIIPQLSSGTSGKQQSDPSQQWAQDIKLGKGAKAGLGNLMNMADPSGGWGVSIEPMSGGSSGLGGMLSGLGGLFGFADGGEIDDSTIFPGEGEFVPPSPAPYRDPDEPSIGSKLWQNLIAAHGQERPITSSWVTPPMPEKNPNFTNVGEIGDRPTNLGEIGNIPADIRSSPNTTEVGGLGALAPDTAQQTTPAQPTGVQPTTYAQISTPLETGKNDPLKGITNISPDTKGSFSYGNFGLNSLPGNSAWQFKAQYGDRFGLTANPGTPEFNAQWKRAAATDPVALNAAENDWHQKNVIAKVGTSLTKVGVPDEIASDPRVQAYFADRMVQQGNGSTIRHASRIQAALNSADGDPVKFLQTMSRADMSQAALTHDFPSALASGRYSDRANQNRVQGRLRLALGVGSEPNTFPGITDAPSAPQVAAAGPQTGPSAGLGALVEKGTSPDAPVVQAGYSTPAAAQQGGLLKRLFGIDFNPLKLSDNERMGLLSAGLGMMASHGNVGAGGLQGLETFQGLEQRDKQAQLQAQQLMMQAKKFGPIGADKFGNPQYGFSNELTNEVTPIKPSIPELAIPDDTHGEEALKMIPAQDAAIVKQMIEGRKAPVSSLAMTKPYWQRMMALASQVDPSFDETKWAERVKAAKDYTPGGPIGKQVYQANTTIQHMLQTSDRAQELNNTWNPTWNKIKNTFNSEVLGKPEVKQFNSALNDYSAELGKLLKVGVLTNKEHDEMISQVGSAGSPAQLNNVIADQAERMAARVRTLQDKRNGIMGGGNSPNLLDPKSINSLNKIYARAGLGNANQYGEPGTKVEKTSTTPAQPPSVNTKAQYDALPSGSIYIDARDGKQKRKS